MLEDLFDTTQKYSAQDFSNLLGLEGFSDDQLKTHFALYEGYVNNVNRILDDLGKLREAGEMDTPEYAELKRRFGWEFNGMRLHELYFGGMGLDGDIDPDGNLYKAIEKNFGSFDKWKNDFVATAKMRGIGWAVLYQDPTNGKLMNFWIEQHDKGHGSGLNPILVIDVFEHAYFIDWGKDKPSYIDAFFKIIRWSEVGKRFR